MTVSPVRLKAMREAIFDGNTKKVRLLLNAGIAGNDADETGRKFIQHAVEHRQFEIVKLLADDGADLKTPKLLISAVNTRGDHGPSPEIAHYILAQVELPQSEIDDALRYACGHDDADLVKALIDRGGNVNLADDTAFRFPLLNALDNGNAAIVQILLDAGADPNLHDVRDYDAGGNVIALGTLIEFAEASGETKIADMLKAA